MATKPLPAYEKEALPKTPRILRGTPEMEALRGLGYGGMTVAEAEAIIKERTANPMAYPYEVLKRAQAFLAAYHTSPIVIDTEPGWHRRRQPQKEV